MEKRIQNRKMFLLFNHLLSQDQKKSAGKNMGVREFVEMPGHLKKLWEQLPADQEQINPIVKPIQDWLDLKAVAGDIVLIQGDFGATFLMVEHAFKKGLVPVYSATVRKSEETFQADGTIKTIHWFKHKMFRLYGY